MIRRSIALLALAGLGVAASGCNVPPELVEVVNIGAAEHAAQHMDAGEPNEEVLCAVDAGGALPSGILIASRLVDQFGCHLSYAWATATRCSVTGIPSTSPLGDYPWFGDTMCEVTQAEIPPIEHVGPSPR